MLVDERRDVVVVQADLRGTDRGEAVVAAALGVARHQVVHDRAALEHDLDDGLERDDAGDGGERVVLADRVAREDRALDERTGLTQLGHLGRGEHRHGDLRELGQEQHAIGVLVRHTSATRTVGLSRTTVRIEKPRASRVCASARSQISRAALERWYAAMPMPWCWMPWPGNAYAVRGASRRRGDMTTSPSARQVMSTSRRRR